MTDAIRQREVVSQGVFYALFRLVEIDELSGSEKAMEWAKAMLDEPELRRGFSEGVLEALARREDATGRPPAG